MKSHARSIFLLLALASCTPALKGPPGPPSISPVGLWVHHSGPGQLEVLRIVCGERCWFRDIAMHRRNLRLSGPVALVTERDGTLLTSATEILQIQTEFRSEQFRLPVDGPTSSTLDRVVYGESRLRLLRFDGPNRLVGDDVAFERRCPASGDCGAPLAAVLESDAGPGAGGKAGGGADADALSLVVVPDVAWLPGAEAARLLADFAPVHSLGFAVLARTSLPVGTTVVLGRSGEKALSGVYENRIALSPGGAALRDRSATRSPEKQRRIDEIRSRLKSGAPVSREEMLEALESNDSER